MLFVSSLRPASDLALVITSNACSGWSLVVLPTADLLPRSYTQHDVQQAGRGTAGVEWGPC